MLGASGAPSHLQGGERTKQEELAQEPYQAMVPLLPARTDASMKEYWRFYLTSVSAIIIFGGLLAPVLEVKMGLGGAGLHLSLGFEPQRSLRYEVTAPCCADAVSLVRGPKSEAATPGAGTTYADFIRNMHLPGQLAAVDPIVASFCGGAVGVLTTLLLVEVNNSDMQARNRCIYCGVSSHSVAQAGGRPWHSPPHCVST